jgi:threonine dehydrogenase-like Zn-dependent dehydrogenase
LIPGHEVVGIVAALGKNVKGFELGQRVVADNSVCQVDFAIPELVTKALERNSAVNVSIAAVVRHYSASISKPMGELY